MARRASQVIAALLWLCCTSIRLQLTGGGLLCMTVQPGGTMSHAALAAFGAGPAAGRLTAHGLHMRQHTGPDGVPHCSLQKHWCDACLSLLLPLLIADPLAMQGYYRPEAAQVRGRRGSQVEAD